VHREHGYQRYLDGDLPGALASYRRAAELAPGDERLWSSLGGLLLASGDDAGARIAFERSLAVRPNYAALSNFGSLRYEAREYAEAEDLYRRAADVDPADFRLWGNLGDATAAQPGQAARARPAYERAAAMAARYIAIRADDAQALALLAWYRANLGDGEGARAALARAEGLGTEPGEVAFLGAQVHALLGERDAARRRIDAAVRHGIAPRRLAASPMLAPLLPGRLALR
jgi:tetratricopeptide (TPR) repeat protein